MQKSLAILTACGVGIVIGSSMKDLPGKIMMLQAAPPQTAPIAARPPSNDGKLRVIVFGAHPDDAEYRGAGVAMKWARAGHHLKLVSATNGDIGHWKQAGGPLAQRRLKEVLEVGRRLGVTTEVLEIHVGEILPTLDNLR